MSTNIGHLEVKIVHIKHTAWCLINNKVLVNAYYYINFFLLIILSSPNDIRKNSEVSKICLNN